MNARTNVQLTPEVVDTIYDLQYQEYAELHVEVLQRVLEYVLRDDVGDDCDRLKLAREVLFLQDTMRVFILPKEGGEQ